MKRPLLGKKKKMNDLLISYIDVLANGNRSHPHYAEVWQSLMGHPDNTEELRALLLKNADRSLLMMDAEHAYARLLAAGKVFEAICMYVQSYVLTEEGRIAATLDPPPPHLSNEVDQWTARIVKELPNTTSADQQLFLASGVLLYLGHQGSSIALSYAAIAHLRRLVCTIIIGSGGGEGSVAWPPPRRLSATTIAVPGLPLVLTMNGGGGNGDRDITPYVASGWASEILAKWDQLGFALPPPPALEDDISTEE